MMLIHNICIAFKGLGSFKNVEIVISDIAAILLKRKKLERFSSCRFQCDFLLLPDVKEWIKDIRDWFTRSHRSEGEDENRNPKKGFK